MTNIAIQVACYRSSVYLPMFLKSLQAQTYTDWTLYCCENSEDPAEQQRTHQLLAASGVPFVFSVQQKNRGFAGGHNALMAMHQAEYILLLNDDAYLASTHLEQCLKRFAADPRAGAVAGIVYRWNAPIDQEEAIGPKTLIDTIGLEYHCLAQTVDRGSGKCRKELESSLAAPQRVFGVSGAVCMLKRSAVEAVSLEKGLFDPTFFMYREDVDLAIRLYRKGFNAWFDPAIVSFHRRSIKASAGVIARIRAERMRPAHLREVMFCNQWKIYAYHLSWKLGAADLVRTGVHELIHLVFIFVSSPVVFLRGVISIVHAGPAAWRRRKALERIGLEHRSWNNL